MRRDAKVDANQPLIVAALRKVGATVQSLATVGKSCPDLLVGFRGENFVIEVKMPGASLEPGQSEWLDNWRGRACVVRTPDDALRVIGAKA